MNTQNQNGFLLIGLLIAVAIIAVLFVALVRPKNEKQGLIQSKQQADKSLEQTNKTLENYQNQINAEQ